MSPVFAHGRLRLYLLKLLDEAPRHGYEVIRLLEERFHGLYAPSAGTVYPRLTKLEQEGLVTHTTESGRKVYRLTDAGRAELAARSAEINVLESEIHDSVAQLADQIREDVRDSAQDLREEMRNATKEARRRRKGAAQGWGPDPVWGAGAERSLSEGIAGLTRTLSGIADPSRWTASPAPEPAQAPAAAPSEGASRDPMRELERLLDRFRDEVRDAARDRGVTAEQVRQAEVLLAETAKRLRGGLG